MKEYHLQIVTPAGSYFDGPCTQITVPAVDGQLGVLADHIPFVTALGAGACKVFTENGIKEGHCAGGMLTVSRQAVRVLASSFEWEK